MRICAKEKPPINVLCLHDPHLFQVHFPDAPLMGCHGDGNRHNNHLDNLRWGTRKSNAEDRLLHGTLLRGENAPGAKLSNAQVVEIKKALARGESLTILSRAHGVAVETINAIRRGESWSWL